MADNDIPLPFNKPFAVGTEQAYIADAIKLGHLSGDGTYTKLCNKLLEETIGVRKALLTTSCTHALEMAAILLDLQPDDEVIVPAFTFVSTVNAFVLHRARPVFADITADTLNLDASKLEQLITKRTKAIVPVHYAGVACDMDAIMSVTKAHGLSVVEDNAHGLFAKFQGRPLGSYGNFAAQSFHETKNFQCGEGGALLINDERFLDRAEIIREKGTNRSRFFRGQVDKYTWVDVGSSYLPSDILAAFLFAQLQDREHIQNRRREIWETYERNLVEWAHENGVRMPVVPANCEQPYHMFYLILPTLQARQQLIEHLKRLKIMAIFHYLPLHLSDMGRKYGGNEGDCPVTEWVSDRLLRLPFYVELSMEDQNRVIRGIQSFQIDPTSRQCATTRTIAEQLG